MGGTDNATEPDLKDGDLRDRSEGSGVSIGVSAKLIARRVKREGVKQ